MHHPSRFSTATLARTGRWLVALLGVCGLSGCVTLPGKVTGGGSIDSVFDSGGTATFGFNADSCSGTPRGHFNYIDKNADPTTWPGGVKMNGDVSDAVQCGAFDIDLVESCFNDPANCPDPGIQQAVNCFNNQDVTCLLETPSVFCALCLVEVFEALGGLDCLSSVPACGAYVVKVDYRSTNPQVPGTGTAFACVLDRGEGANGTTDGAGDVGLVAALDGPYAPNGLFGAGAYVNAGFVQGNIQAHSCHE